MPRIAASIVFPASSLPRRNGVVTTDADGTVVSVSKGSPSFGEMAGVQYYSGILVPGFVDVMCGGAPDPAWLLTRGVRVAGTTAVPPGASGPAKGSKGHPDGGSGHAGDTLQLSWQGRYGGVVDFLVFRQMIQFDRRFSKGPAEGVLLRGETDKPVLAGYGKKDLLSVMLELQESHGYKLPDLLAMATVNGAYAAGYGSVAGSIEPGRNPGLNIIEGADLQQMKLLPGSRLRRLC